MLFVLPQANATIAEVEIGIPALAARYAAATGESVEVPRALSRRAIALFAKNAPWTDVMALAGRAGGFAVERSGRRTRLAPRARLDRSELESGLNAKLAALLALPTDLRLAIAERRKLMAAPLQTDPYARPLSFLELDDLRRERDRKGLAAASPEYLAIGRFLSRHGRFSIGATRVLKTEYLLSKAELRAFGESPSAETSISEALRIAVRMTTSGLVVATSRSDGNGESSPRITRIDTTVGPARRLWDFLPYSYYSWPERRLTRRVSPYGLAIGDYLERLHLVTGWTCAAPAIRIDAGSYFGRAVFQLHAERARDGDDVGDNVPSFVATSGLGDGFWPEDIAKLDRESLQTLNDEARRALRLDPLQRAALREGIGLLGRTDLSPLLDGGSFLRFLGEASDRDRERIIGGQSFIDAEMDPATRAALLRCLDEERAPASALDPISKDAPLIIRAEDSSESTGAQWRYRFLYGVRKTPYLLRLESREVRPLTSSAKK